mmetsp:Transcript_54078/g.128804  ORF Transcript_54078/g.128804 Transcript_54078/m.128804 type:complete len:573 (+) Transcript_54078:114-1832(+)
MPRKPWRKIPGARSLKGWFSSQKAASQEAAQGSPSYRSEGAENPQSEQSEEVVVSRHFLNAVYGRDLNEEDALKVLNFHPLLGWIVECHCLAPIPPLWVKSKVVPPDVPLYAGPDGDASETSPLFPYFARMAHAIVLARQVPDRVVEYIVQVISVREQMKQEVIYTQGEWSGPHVDVGTGEDYWRHKTAGYQHSAQPWAWAVYVMSVADRILRSGYFAREDLKAGSAEYSKSQRIAQADKQAGAEGGERLRISAEAQPQEEPEASPSFLDPLPLDIPVPAPLDVSLCPSPTEAESGQGDAWDLLNELTATLAISDVRNPAMDFDMEPTALFALQPPPTVSLTESQQEAILADQGPIEEIVQEMDQHPGQDEQALEMLLQTTSTMAAELEGELTTQLAQPADSSQHAPPPPLPQGPPQVRQLPSLPMPAELLRQQEVQMQPINSVLEALPAETLAPAHAAAEAQPAGGEYAAAAPMMAAPTVQEESSRLSALQHLATTLQNLPPDANSATVCEILQAIEQIPASVEDLKLTRLGVITQAYKDSLDPEVKVCARRLRSRWKDMLKAEATHTDLQ